MRFDRNTLLATVAGVSAMACTGAFAQTAPAAPPAAPAKWADGITFGLQLDGGLNFSSGAKRTNFGQLFDDKPNSLMLNQALATVSRVIDPKVTGWDVGFKLQGMYGSDARYTHLLGFLDNKMKDRNQLDLVEANVTVHMPVLTEGGIDVKGGIYTTPLGFETIDPSTNPFYSHSYIFNFGLPFKHTGVLAIVHASDVIDVYGGVDTGVNTSIGAGDNNSALALTAGFGLNLLDGNLTVLALTHIGPENASKAVPGANKFQRYLNDAFVTWKATEKLSLTTEVNYVKDDFAKADAFGFAQYAAYTLNDTMTLNGRVEAFRDGKGFFVGAFPGNRDFANAELGLPATVLGGTHTTYGAATIGMTFKPELPKPIAGLILRPELRYDTALDSTKPFNGGKARDAVTISADAVLSF